METLSSTSLPIPDLAIPNACLGQWTVLIWGFWIFYLFGLALDFFFLFQVMGKVPTISINKTEGCHIYLSEDALDCEIVSAKSSEMNILIPQDGDYVSTF